MTGAHDTAGRYGTPPRRIKRRPVSVTDKQCNCAARLRPTLDGAEYALQGHNMNRSILRKVILAILFGDLLFSVPVSADHLPEHLQARGKPEKTLAGIHLDRTRLKDMIKLYGKPSRIDGDYYHWNKSGVNLRVLIYRRPETVSGEFIGLIEVQGRKAGSPIGRTGKGLRLGDSKADLKRLYGNKFNERKGGQPWNHVIHIQWRRVEISLIAEFDGDGRIKSLSLSPGE
jgi:hypothetical protein